MLVMMEVFWAGTQDGSQTFRQRGDWPQRALATDLGMESGMQVPPVSRQKLGLVEGPQLSPHVCGRTEGRAEARQTLRTHSHLPLLGPWLHTLSGHLLENLRKKIKSFLGHRSPLGLWVCTSISDSVISQ